MSLVKLIDASSFFPDEPQVNIIDFDKTKGMLKQAADSRVAAFTSSIMPEPDKIYVHILAMGAGEYFGANRNADYFPENNLLDHYKTFETSPAHIFRNHINKDPKKAIGQVIFAIYNERMHRVEVVAWIDKNLGADIVRRLEAGDFPATSMACRTPYDVCSICGNKAHTRQEYCDHLSSQLGKVYPDGRKVMALNVAPLKFFDMSIVVRPADITSSILQKVASENEDIHSSVDAAEEAGLGEVSITKQATLKKLSEFIKEVDGEVVDYSGTVDKMLNKTRDPELALIPTLKNFKLHDVFSTMAHLGISPSISFLAELIAIKTHGDHMEGVGNLVQSFVSQLGADNVSIPEEEYSALHDPVPSIASALSAQVPDCSLLPEFVEKRAYHGYGAAGNVGYVGNGPFLEPTNYEKFKATNLKGDEKSQLVKILSTILAIGGAAIAAKWYITRAIEAKTREMSDHNINSPVKIILVKSASDYKLTYQLAKAAMIRVLKKV